MKLIAGLGNPGSKYDNTRHNVGFMALDGYIKSLTLSQNLQFIDDKNNQAQWLKIDDCVFVKPQTYMNNSGIAVKKLKDFYKISNILVIHDDLDLHLGAVRFKFGGSSGGHNGLKSIDESISKEYIRLRIGIGHPREDSKSSDFLQEAVIDYVLSRFNPIELQVLDGVFQMTNNAIEAFMQGADLEVLQNKYTKRV